MKPESIEITCRSFDDCIGECGLVCTIKKHIEDSDLLHIEVRCVDAQQEARVWSNV